MSQPVHQVMLRINPELFSRIEEQAADQGLSMNKLISQVLEKGISPFTASVPRHG
jgi:predicted HicB family RNase H-like nuclease